MAVTYWARNGNSAWVQVPTDKMRLFRKLVPEAQIKVRVSRKG